VDIKMAPDRVIPVDIKTAPDRVIPVDIKTAPDRVIPVDIKVVPDQPVPPDKNMPKPTCTDKIKNGNETDIDCGGGTCPKCANGKTCKGATDCINGMCSGAKCSHAGSCKALLGGNPSIKSGVYSIAPKKGGAAIMAYCDMTSAGGGWTMVAAQYEADQMTDWGEGTQTDYDPTLGTSRSFSLNSAQLPAHTQTAFGKDKSATFVGYSTFVYHTGDIPKTAVKNLKDSKNYHIHRSKGVTYGSFDPDGNPVTSWCPQWCNALVYDISPGAFSWTYAPNAKQIVRGYGMAGKVLQTSAEAYAWTVWVK